jgi:hypothetical protein
MICDCAPPSDQLWKLQEVSVSLALTVTSVPQSTVKVSLPLAGTVSRLVFQDTSMGQQPSEMTSSVYGPRAVQLAVTDLLVPSMWTVAWLPSELSTPNHWIKLQHSSESSAARVTLVQQSISSKVSLLPAGTVPSCPTVILQQPMEVTVRSEVSTSQLTSTVLLPSMVTMAFAKPEASPLQLTKLQHSSSTPARVTLAPTGK